MIMVEEVDLVETVVEEVAEGTLEVAGVVVAGVVVAGVEALLDDLGTGYALAAATTALPASKPELPNTANCGVSASCVTALSA